MIEYTLLNVHILELKICCGPDKFYGRSKIGAIWWGKGPCSFQSKTTPLFIRKLYVSAHIILQQFEFIFCSPWRNSRPARRHAIFIIYILHDHVSSIAFGLKHFAVSLAFMVEAAFQEGDADSSWIPFSMLVPTGPWMSTTINYYFVKVHNSCCILQRHWKQIRSGVIITQVRWFVIKPSVYDINSSNGLVRGLKRYNNATEWDIIMFRIFTVLLAV